MIVKYAFLAETASQDKDQKVSAIGIFDVITAVSFPAIHRDMVLVAQLEGTAREAGDHTVSIELRDEGQNKLAELKLPLILISSRLVHGIYRSGIVVKLQDLLFPKVGHYEFVIFVNDRFLHRVTFTVQQVRGTGEA